MTPYADEKFYKDEYLSGSRAVITTAVPFFLAKASLEVKSYTLGRVKPDSVTHEVKLCTCAVADLLFKYKDSESRAVTSEHVGDVSKTYESSEQAALQLNRQIRHTVLLYLGDTGLLYRGVE